MTTSCVVCCHGVEKGRQRKLIVKYRVANISYYKNFGFIPPPNFQCLDPLELKSKDEKQWFLFVCLLFTSINQLPGLKITALGFFFQEPASDPSVICKKPALSQFSCFILQRYEMPISSLVDSAELPIYMKNCVARGRLPLFKAMNKWTEKQLRKALYEIQDFEKSIGILSGEIPRSDQADSGFPFFQKHWISSFLFNYVK